MLSRSTSGGNVTGCIETVCGVTVLACAQHAAVAAKRCSTAHGRQSEATTCGHAPDVKKEGVACSGRARATSTPIVSKPALWLIGGEASEHCKCGFGAFGFTAQNACGTIFPAGSSPGLQACVSYRPCAAWYSASASIYLLLASLHVLQSQVMLAFPHSMMEAA